MRLHDTSSVSRPLPALPCIHPSCTHTLKRPYLSSGLTLSGCCTLCYTSPPAPACKELPLEQQIHTSQVKEHTCSHACTRRTPQSARSRESWQSRNKTNPSVSVVDPNPLFHLASKYISSLLSRLIPPVYISIPPLSVQENNTRGLICVNADAGGNCFTA